MDLKDAVFEAKLKLFKDFYGKFAEITALEIEKLRKYFTEPAENLEKCHVLDFKRKNLFKTKEICTVKRKKTKKLDFKRKKAQVFCDFSRKEGEISLNSSFYCDYLKNEAHKNLKIEEEIDLS